MKKITPYKNIDKLFDLKDRVCLVVGIGGIGKVAAEAFVERGAKVVVADISIKAVEGEEIKINDEIVKAYSMDISKKDSVQAVVDKVVEVYGRVDVLVNAAGVAKLNKAINVDAEELERQLDINLKGTIFTCQCVGKVMVSQGYGKIINLGSIGGERGHTSCSLAYAASKGGVHQATRSFAGEFAEFGVNVNAIAPTWVSTPMTLDRPEYMYEGMKNTIPFGRMVEPHELIGTIIFLASEASNFVTGIILPVDGGFLATKIAY